MGIQSSGQSETSFLKYALPSALNCDALLFQTKVSQRQPHGVCCPVNECSCYCINSRWQCLRGNTPRNYECTMAVTGKFHLMPTDNNGRGRSKPTENK